MATSRYAYSGVIKNGKLRATALVSAKIYNAVEAGLIDVSVGRLSASQRLDTIAGAVYGDSSLWWIIAAASGIGWGMQVPPGVTIKVPTSVGSVYGVL